MDLVHGRVRTVIRIGPMLYEGNKLEHALMEKRMGLAEIPYAILCG